MKENLLSREVGRFLHEVQTARVEADYKGKSFSKEEVTELINRGKTVLETIEAYVEEMFLKSEK